MRTTQTNRDQVRALLLGVAVGDALGVPVEFRARGTFHVTDMEGYGTYNQPPGTWSDDTSLTLALADALEPGSCDLAAIARGMQAWYNTAAYTPHGEVFDVGGATARAIHRLNEGISPDHSGGSGERDNGNGSLMRIAPLVFPLAGIREPEARYRLVRQVSGITHAHPCSVTACFLFTELLEKLRAAGREGAEDGPNVLTNAYSGLQKEVPTLAFLDHKALASCRRILAGDISILPESAIDSSGYVVHTLEASLWSLLTTDNYRDAVLRAVNLGEDTDTTAAVTGALAGLTYGLGGTRGIPEAWVEQLAGCDGILRIADKLALCCP